MNSLLDSIIKFMTDEITEKHGDDMNNVPRNIIKIIKKQIENFDKDVPRIAIIGNTGVGKSSTINEMFSINPPIKVGHIVATTKEVQFINVYLDKDRGSIIIVDFPGLGESILADEEYIPSYKKILPTCDVILWILKADDRTLAQDQRYLRDVLTDETRQRLVIGLNQVDKIQPGQWIEEYNVPSREQEEGIEVKIADIKDKLNYVGIKKEQIIFYSALKRYRLSDMQVAMLAACPKKRKWILSKRQKIKPFTSPY